MNTTCIKIKDAPKKGEYQPTKTDTVKSSVDFRLVDMNYIIWKDGTGEHVNKRKLSALQKKHSWTTDF